MRLSKIAAVAILMLGVCVMIFAGTRLLQAEQIYREGNEHYDALRDRIKGTEATGSSVQTGLYTSDLKIDIPRLDIDFEALKAINEDVAAWLYCPDTVIDYPVMKAADYSYYLSHLPDGKANANGSLFIDYNNSPDFGDPLTVIYGHHMKSGAMFGSLKGYKEQGYYDEHPYMYLYTEHGNHRIDLLYGCVIGAGQWRDRAFMYPENASVLLSYAEHNTTFESGARFKDGDRIIALSTCSYEFNDARYVVIGILR